MMNKRKNSSRSAAGSGNNTTNRSSPRSRGPIAEGVYNNSHFLHAAASQVGNNVRVKTKGGVVVEGIFRTFSENFHIALEVPHRYQNGGDDKKINVDTVQDNLIIKLCDIVTIEAKDVDLEYATRDTFQTDTAIASRLNGPFRHGEKELEPWMDSPDTSGINGEMNVNLELDTKVNGWDANEMFSLNEKEHGIKTTYKDNLESYTVQIEKKDTMDFRKQELEAERIANEIENNPTTKERLDLENGDEESVFAAVARPDDQNSNMIINSNNTNNNSEKMTPPPSSQNKYIPKQQRTQTKMMPGSKMYSKPMQTVPQQQTVQQTVINGGAGFKTITINPPHQFNQPPPSHYVTQQQQQQQQQNQNQQSQQQQIQHNQQVLNNPEVNKMNNNDGREMGRENSNNNNNNNNSNKSMPPPRNMRIMNPPPQIPTSFNEPPPQLNQVQQQQVSNQHMAKPINMHIPPPHLQAVQAVAQDQPTAVHVLPQSVVVVAHPSQIPIHPAPQQQRPQRDPVMRSRNDDIRSLRQFHNDFQMAPPSAPQVPQQSSQAIQTMPPQNRPEMQDNGQMVHIPQQQNSSGPTSVDNNSQQPPPHMKSHVNNNSNNNNNNNANINHHITHHPTPSSTPHQEKSHGPTTPPQANTPQQQNVNSSNSVISNNTSSTSGINSTISDVSIGNDKATLGTKKFTLNPQAKPFTPRNPSTPNQSSRPHTPQTPGPMAQAPQQPIPPPQQQVVYAPSGPLLYIVPSQQRPATQATLTRKTQFHQFQVTQATGQPIFNPPAPPQAVMPYHQMQTVQSQTYPQAIRMYPHEISAQQQPHLTSYLVPTPPSTTPSPGQPHQQTFHPGPQPSAGPPTQTFQPPGSYVMLMPSNAPPFVYNQHNPQSFQIVSSAMPQQQHPAQ